MILYEAKIEPKVECKHQWPNKIWASVCGFFLSVLLCISWITSRHSFDIELKLRSGRFPSSVCGRVHIMRKGTGETGSYVHLSPETVLQPLVSPKFPCADTLVLSSNPLLECYFALQKKNPKHVYEDNALDEALHYMSPNSKGYPELELQLIFSNWVSFYPFMLCQAKIPHPNKNAFKPWRWNINFVPWIYH